jgi:hypothetical protein
MKNKYALLLGLILVPLANGFAQQTNTAAQQTNTASQQTNTGFSVIAFDIGYAPAYSFAPSPIGGIKTVPTFALNLKITDPLVVGFSTVIVDSESIGTLNLKYSFMPKIRLTAGFGKASGAALSFDRDSMIIAFGFEMIPFSRNVQSVATDFKLNIQYLFQPALTIADFSHGLLLFGLNIGLGV